MAGGLHHIHLRVLARLGLASAEDEGRTRTQIVFVEDAQERRKIGFLHRSLGSLGHGLELAKDLQRRDLELPDRHGLVLLKPRHDILLGLTGGKAGNLQKPHNARRCLIFQCGDLEKWLEACDSHASHTSILKTSLRVHDLGLFAVQEGIVLVPITRLELHTATLGFLRKLVSVFPCPSVNVRRP